MATKLRLVKSPNPKVKLRLAWAVTPWQMKGDGTWLIQPIIVVQGQQPFFADHPQAYIDKLLALHDDPTLIPLQNLHTMVGQLKDGLEHFWGGHG